MLALPLRFALVSLYFSLATHLLVWHSGFVDGTTFGVSSDSHSSISSLDASPNPVVEPPIIISSAHVVVSPLVFISSELPLDPLMPNGAVG